MYAREECFERKGVPSKGVWGRGPLENFEI